ncbi:unnamed protein product, partial [Ixodes persulcatus]
MSEKTNEREQYPEKLCDFVIIELARGPQTPKKGRIRCFSSYWLRYESRPFSVQKFHEAFKENGSRTLLLMFGMQLKAFKSSVEEFLANLQHISKVVDYTILETHHFRPAPTCNLLMPNSFRVYTDLADTLPIITALDWAKQLQSLVVPPPNVCFSLNLAALHYELKSTSIRIGAPCQSETLVRYNQ